MTFKFRKLRRGWDDLLGEMLNPEPKQRPDWKDLWHRGCKILGEKNHPMVSKTIWLGGEDHQTQTFFKERLFKAEEQPQAIALQAFPGREKIARVAPFTRFAEKEGFLVFHVWVGGRENRQFKMVNDVIHLLKNGVVRHLDRPDIERELEPISEFLSTEELMVHWRGLLDRIMKLLIPDHCKGIVLLIEDIQHLDPASMTAVMNFSSWLAHVPFLLVITGHTFAHPHFRNLADSLSFKWHFLHPEPLSEKRLSGLVWKAEESGALEREKQILKDVNQEEILFFFRLGQPSDFRQYLNLIWEFLRPKEKLVLKVLSCSERPLSKGDMESAFAMVRLGGPLKQLSRLKFVGVSEASEFSVKIPAMLSFCLEKITESDLNLIRSKLLKHEQALGKPDPVQLAYLSGALNCDGGQDQYLKPLRELVFGQFELGYLWRLSRVYKQTKMSVFSDFSMLADILRGTAVDPAPFRGRPDLADLVKASLLAHKGAYHLAAKAYFSAAIKQNTPLGIKAYCLLMAAENGTLAEDRPTLNKTWRKFFGLELSSISTEVHHEWLVRFASAALKLDVTLPELNKALEHVAAPLRDWLRVNELWLEDRFKAALKAMNGALDRVKRHYDLNWKGTSFKLYGNLLYRNYLPEEAIRAYLAAEDCFIQTANLAELDNIRFNLATTENLAGRFISSRINFEPLYQQAQKSEDDDYQCQILYNLMVCSLFQNDLERFDREFATHAKLAKRTKSREERVKGLALWLHGALGRNKETVREAMCELRALLSDFQPNPLLTVEAEAGLRFGGFVLGERPDRSEFETSELASWRHRFLDYFSGQKSLALYPLLEKPGSGFFGAFHLFILKSAVEAGMIPEDALTQSVAAHFEKQIRANGSHYRGFLRKHFSHLRNLGDVPRRDWERALRLFEAIQWRVVESNALIKQLLRDLDKIWSFDRWGACSFETDRWVPLEFEGHAVLTDEIAQHLSQLNMQKWAGPLVTTMLDPKSQSPKSLLILPITFDRHCPRLVWFIHDRAAAHDLGSHYEPLFRFYGKIFEFAWYKTVQNRPEPATPTGSAIDSQSYEPFHGIVGKSTRLRQALRKIQKYAPSDLNIYIWGESGTGKELAAFALHKESLRNTKPFRAINCSHFSEQLVESALFGHVRGAFTGATGDHVGLLEQVNGGTLFIDEVGDINGKVQSLLLRVLQEGEFSRVGENRVRKVDIRFVSATNKDIHSLIDTREFREDLYFRLVGEEINLPPLRDRFEDLPILAAHFVKKYEPDRSVCFTKDFFATMRSYDWPGNIRELENYVRKTLIDEPRCYRFTALQCPPFQRQRNQVSPENETLGVLELQFRMKLVKSRLEQLGGNRTRTAESLGITRQALLKLMKKFHIN